MLLACALELCLAATWLITYSLCIRICALELQLALQLISLAFNQLLSSPLELWEPQKLPPWRPLVPLSPRSPISLWHWELPQTQSTTPWWSHPVAKWNEMMVNAIILVLQQILTTLGIGETARTNCINGSRTRPISFLFQEGVHCI